MSELWKYRGKASKSSKKCIFVKYHKLNIYRITYTLMSLFEKLSCNWCDKRVFNKIPIMTQVEKPFNGLWAVFIGYFEKMR